MTDAVRSALVNKQYESKLQQALQMQDAEERTTRIQWRKDRNGVERRLCANHRHCEGEECQVATQERNRIDGYFKEQLETIRRNNARSVNRLKEEKTALERKSRIERGVWRLEVVQSRLVPPQPTDKLMLLKTIKELKTWQSCGISRLPRRNRRAECIMFYNAIRHVIVAQLRAPFSQLISFALMAQLRSQCSGLDIPKPSRRNDPCPDFATLEILRRSQSHRSNRVAQDVEDNVLPTDAGDNANIRVGSSGATSDADTKCVSRVNRVRKWR
eukprot:GEMP01032882.1.p1 GENE.GEMP01032882.1~~GEMP01032882.1.p1  ORF type:complete len:272 (+),score=70.00 GEMP01032882.1:864-1679(+)